MDNLFIDSGALGHPPEGSKMVKVFTSSVFMANTIMNIFARKKRHQPDFDTCVFEAKSAAPGNPVMLEHHSYT